MRKEHQLHRRRGAPVVMTRPGQPGRGHFCAASSRMGTRERNWRPQVAQLAHQPSADGTWVEGLFFRPPPVVKLAIFLSILSRKILRHDLDIDALESRVQENPQDL